VNADQVAVEVLGDRQVPNRLLSCRRTIGDVISSVAELLGVRWGFYVHELRASRRFEDWRMNDLDSMCAGMLLAAGIDPNGSSHREVLAEVHDIVRRHFRSTSGQ
jgi:hypothetical protein